jgi:hypothetical protein
MSVAPAPVARRQIHQRRITCEAFEREDGLIELEGLLVDTKPVPVRLVTGKTVPPARPIHQMRVRLAVDRDGVIREARAYSEVSPYPECAGIEAAYRQLVGMRIQAGFPQAVKRLFRGIGGCTHITELIPPMATILFQVLWADSDFVGSTGRGPGERPTPVGGCHGLRLDGEVARTYFSGSGEGHR